MAIVFFEPRPVGHTTIAIQHVPSRSRHLGAEKRCISPPPFDVVIIAEVFTIWAPLRKPTANSQTARKNEAVGIEVRDGRGQSGACLQGGVKLLLSCGNLEHVLYIDHHGFIYLTACKPRKRLRDKVESEGGP
jgi:hypothetical protein